MEIKFLAFSISKTHFIYFNTPLYNTPNINGSIFISTSFKFFFLSFFYYFLFSSLSLSLSFTPKLFGSLFLYLPCPTPTIFLPQLTVDPSPSPKPPLPSFVFVFRTWVLASLRFELCFGFSLCFSLSLHTVNMRCIAIHNPALHFCLFKISALLILRSFSFFRSTLFSCVVFYFYVLCGGFGCGYAVVSMAVVIVYCSVYIILLCCLYYFNVLNTKIKSLILNVLSTSNSGAK